MNEHCKIWHLHLYVTLRLSRSLSLCQIAALDLLVNIATGDAEVQHAACVGDVLPCVLLAMDAHLLTADVQERACVALSSFSDSVECQGTEAEPPCLH